MSFIANLTDIHFVPVSVCIFMIVQDGLDSVLTFDFSREYYFIHAS